MRAERASSVAGIAIAAALGLWTVLLLTRGSVTIGAGDSAGFERPLRDILRAANRALVSTGWDDTWRVAGWACGAGAVVLAVVLVWLASAEGDAPTPTASKRVSEEGRYAAARQPGPNGHGDVRQDAAHAPHTGVNAPGTTGTVA